MKYRARHKYAGNLRLAPATRTPRVNAMNRINLIDIETPWGYRSFELHQGDITQLDFPVDVLAISAFRNDYEPVPGTVIAALLSNCGIDLKALSSRREFDLVDSFGCWIAQVTPNSIFKRIICIEMVGGNFELGDVIENLFAVLTMLEMKGVKPKTLALPVLGAGQQRQDPTIVIKELLACSLRYMHHSASIKRIIFVARREERARQLDTGMNDVLGRVKVVMPRGDLYERARKRIIESIDSAREIVAPDGAAVLIDARRIFSSDQIRSFEMGIASRRILEFIVRDISQKKVGTDLCGKIEELGTRDIAEWIRSYMHVLRVFGNESAHEKHKVSRKPPIVTESDMGLCLLCLHRVLDFWLGLKTSAAATQH